MKLMQSIVVCAMLSTATGAAAETIQYIGSSTVGQYMHEAANVYANAEFDINTEPESGGGEMATAAGRTDIGGVARDVKPEILDKGVKKFLIGKDAIGILVHPSNPVSDLSFEQLRGIFSGNITNWNAVGGPDLPIDVYLVNPQSATRGVFQRVVMGDAKYGGKRVTTIRPDPKIIEEIEIHRGGIGQLSFSFLGDAKVKRIRPNGEEASVNNANYPITRNLHLVTKGEPTGIVKEFIEWTLSADGQAIVKKFFVGIASDDEQ